MLTLLTIEDRPESIWRKSPLRALPVNTARVLKMTSDRHIEIRYLKYICRNGRISWRKIRRLAKEGRSNLIYSGEEPPKDAGISVFSPRQYRCRLCANMALACLEAMGEKALSLNVGLYDPFGDAVDLSEHLLKFSKKLVVVTGNSRIYETEANRLMWETGAPLSVSRRVSSLSRCSLVVATSLLDRVFTPDKNAVVLTCDEPKIPLECRVYYRFGLRLPPEFQFLCPDGLDTELFAAGLYSLGRVHSLGAVVPLLCRSQTDTQTYLSLGRHLEECFST